MFSFVTYNIIAYFVSNCQWFHNLLVCKDRNVLAYACIATNNKYLKILSIVFEKLY